MIWLIGGTSDATHIAEQLLSLNHKLIVTVVSEQGRLACKGLECSVFVGAMDADRMGAFIREHDVEQIVDASHPFAQNVSENALIAAQKAKLNYVRYERPLKRYSSAMYVNSYEEAVDFLSSRDGNVLLTTGSRMLQKFSPLKTDRLFVRVMPCREGLEACEVLGISMKQILAFNGQVSTELNYQIIREFNIRYVVSKDSGDAGALPEKVTAAERAGIPIIIIERPRIVYPELCSSFEELLSKFRT